MFAKCSTRHRLHDVDSFYQLRRGECQDFSILQRNLARRKRASCIWLNFVGPVVTSVQSAAATAVELGGFLKANVAAKSHLLTDGFKGYQGREAALAGYLRHTPVIQGEGVNAGEFFPIIHTVFSNIKAWLVGTHHGVSAKHLPRYLREWAYRFNRRNLSGGLVPWLIRRAVECATITYDQIVAGSLDGGATRNRRVAKPALVG